MRVSFRPFGRKTHGINWPGLPGQRQVLEGLFVIGLFVYAYRRDPAQAGWLKAPAAVLAVLFVQMSPWLSPMKIVAERTSGHAASVIHGTLVTIGFLVPGLLITALVARSDSGRLLAEDSSP